MPNKTIYVPDADLTVFDKAQKLSGNNLSATIVQALRLFIKTKEGTGFTHIEVTVGEKGTYQRKRFIGKELIRTRTLDNMNSKTYIIYETAKEHFALYTIEKEKQSLEQLIEREIEQRVLERLDAGASRNLPPESGRAAERDKRNLDIFHTKEALQGRVPNDLYDVLQTLAEGEFLDI